MRTAIIHDWLTGMRGGEKCLEVFCELFPDATIFTLLHNKGSVSETIERMKIETSFLQHLPLASTRYRSYLPLFPMAVESFNLSGFDLILSSSHCVAKGARVPENTLHICYCHTPMRYAWIFFNEYFGNSNIFKKKIIPTIIKRLKKWDLEANKGVDFFVANSDNVRSRIKNFYNRDADVIYPPVETDRFSLFGQKGDYYLIVSALVPYKRIDLAVKAFNISGEDLVIIGTGDYRAQLEKIAKPNIKFLGWVSGGEILDYYAKCRALIFPGEEDFGIVPLEAQACGKPVIAYGKGGVLETVIPINPEVTGYRLQVTGYRLQVAGHRSQVTGHRLQVTGYGPTGVFFYEQTPEALIEAVEYFERVKDEFRPQSLRENALRFDRSIFKQRFKEYINFHHCERTK